MRTKAARFLNANLELINYLAQEHFVENLTLVGFENWKIHVEFFNEIHLFKDQKSFVHGMEKTAFRFRVRVGVFTDPFS